VDGPTYPLQGLHLEARVALMAAAADALRARLEALPAPGSESQENKGDEMTLGLGQEQPARASMDMEMEMEMEMRVDRRWMQVVVHLLADATSDTARAWLGHLPVAFAEEIRASRDQLLTTLMDTTTTEKEEENKKSDKARDERVDDLGTLEVATNMDFGMSAGSDLWRPGTERIELHAQILAAIHHASCTPHPRTNTNTNTNTNTTASSDMDKATTTDHTVKASTFPSSSTSSSSTSLSYAMMVINTPEAPIVISDLVFTVANAVATAILALERRPLAPLSFAYAHPRPYTSLMVDAGRERVDPTPDDSSMRRALPTSTSTTSSSFSSPTTLTRKGGATRWLRRPTRGGRGVASWLHPRLYSTRALERFRNQLALAALVRAVWFR
jgi:hypothetical protein